MSEIKQKRGGRKIVYRLILAGLLTLAVLLWWWAPWQDTIQYVKVTITTDKTGATTLYRRKTVFRGSQGERPEITAELDLSKWAGQLVRLDIASEVKRRGANDDDNYVSCAAELITPHDTAPLEFIGWANSGSKEHHTGVIGSPAYILRGSTSPLFVYSKSGRLWRAWPVAKQSRLRLTFKPALSEEVVGKPVLYRPSLSPKSGSRATPVSAGKTKPNVFIYLIDALRADHLSCYGYSRPTSPQIDAFAAQATLFEQANNTWTATLPSVASIMTGLYVSAHKVIISNQDRLDPTVTILPEVLGAAGYKNCWISTNPYVSAFYGFDRGVDAFKYGERQTPDWVNAQAAEFLAKYPAGQPVFMYLHTIEPHSPYDPEPETFKLFDRGFKGKCEGSVEELKHLRVYPDLSQEDLAHLIDRYDAEIYDNDAGFADFLQLLKRTGRLENSLIILVADHGESFNEQHTMEHGYVLNREEMQVPLIIKFPGARFAGERVKTRVSTIDIFPTVLAEVGLTPKLAYALPGLDLAQITEGTIPTSRPLFAEMIKGHKDRDIELAAIIDEAGYKQVIDTSQRLSKGPTEGALGLWDLKVDGNEKKDLSQQLPVLASYHEQRIALWLLQQYYWRTEAAGDKNTAAGERDLPEDIRRGLKALGYLD